MTVSTLATLHSLPATVRTLVGATAIFALGEFLVAALIAVYLRQETGLSVLAIGTVVTTTVVTQQVVPLAGGLLIDRYGAQATLAAGLALRVAGYLLFALAGDELVALLAAAFVVGLGGAFLAPGVKALIAEHAGDRAIDGYAMRNVAVNIGASAGPLLGAALLVVDFRAAFLTSAAACAAALVLVVKLGVPASQRAPFGAPRVATAFLDARLRWVTLSSAGFWAAYTQVYLTVPLAIEATTGSAWLAGVLSSGIALIAVATQTRALAAAEPRVGRPGLLPLGTVMVAVAFLALAVLPVATGIAAFVVLFSLGEVLVVTALDATVANLAPAGHAGSYFGVATFGWALGAFVGGITGGAAYDLVAPLDALWALWLAVAGVSLATGWLLHITARPAWAGSVKAV